MYCDKGTMSENSRMSVSFLQIIFSDCSFYLLFQIQKTPGNQFKGIMFIHCLLRISFYNRFDCHSPGGLSGVYSNDNNMLHLYIASQFLK